MEYRLKLSKSQEKELKQEAILSGIVDVGEYLLEKMKTVIRWEESESVRKLMEEEVLTPQQKGILKEFAEKYFEDLSKARVFFENEEHFVLRLQIKLRENNIQINH